MDTAEMAMALAKYELLGNSEGVVSLLRQMVAQAPGGLETLTEARSVVREQISADQDEDDADDTCPECGNYCGGSCESFWDEDEEEDWDDDAEYEGGSPAPVNRDLPEDHPFKQGWDD